MDLDLPDDAQVLHLPRGGVSSTGVAGSASDPAQHEASLNRLVTYILALIDYSTVALSQRIFASDCTDTADRTVDGGDVGGVYGWWWGRSIIDRLWWHHCRHMLASKWEHLEGSGLLSQAFCSGITTSTSVDLQTRVQCHWS